MSIVNQKKHRVFLGALFMLALTPQLTSTYNFFNTAELKLDLATMSQLSLAMSIAYFGSVLMINFVFKEQSFKRFFIITGLISAFLNFSLLIIILKGYKFLGISALLCCFILHSSVTFFQELNLLPLLGACCRLCPEDLQTSGYSIFTAYFNLATCFASLFASLMLRVLNTSTKNYGNLWLLIVFQVAYQSGMLYWLNKIEFPKPEIDQSTPGETAEDQTVPSVTVEIDQSSARKRSGDWAAENDLEKVKLA